MIIIITLTCVWNENIRFFVQYNICSIGKWTWWNYIKYIIIWLLSPHCYTLKYMKIWKSIIREKKHIVVVNIHFFRGGSAQHFVDTDFKPSVLSGFSLMILFYIFMYFMYLKCNSCGLIIKLCGLRHKTIPAFLRMIDEFSFLYFVSHKFYMSQQKTWVK